MHIPDGVLTNTTCVTTLALGGSILAYASYKSVQSGPSCKTIGIAAAATILLQAVNFPVSETISGHFLGAAVLGWLFGPWAAIAIMGITLGAQALLLGDGGITAFGANLLALGIIPVLILNLAKRTTQGENWTFHLASVAGAASLSSYLASAASVGLLMTFGSTIPSLETSAGIMEMSLLPAILEGLVTGSIIYWLHGAPEIRTVPASTSNASSS